MFNLSEAALDLLRLILDGGRAPVAANLESYRELARAGLMDPISGFAHGPEANFRINDEAWARREEWLNLLYLSPLSKSS